MNKLTKILSALAFASAVSAGMVFVAGCDACNPTTPTPSPEEHTHTYSPDWTYDNTNHWHAATCEHTDLKSDEAPHADANNDGICDVCGYDKMPVTPYNVGIEISKTVTEYVLDGSTTANVALDDISVNLVKNDGTDGDKLTEYTTKYYKGQEELTKEQMATAGAGAYNIWVSASIDSNGAAKTAESFVIVYVVDELVSIQFNADAAGTVTTQEVGTTDLMSPTWNFTATFKSGATLPLTANDVDIENVNTASATDAGVANISYEYVNAKGELQEKETTVNYTITAPQTGGEPQVNNYAMDLSLLNGTADKTKLTAADMVGANEFLTIAEGANVVARTNKAGDTVTSIETKGEGMSVTFAGTGTITISFCSTGSSNTSELGLKGPDGTLLIASNDASIAAENKESAGLYLSTGTASGAVGVTYEITTSGTYTICTAVTPGAADKAKYDRAARLLAVTMTDTVGGSSVAETHNYAFNLNEVIAALTVDGVAPADKTALTAACFAGESNSFLTLITDGMGSSDQYRTSGGGCIEIKNDRLQVTFEGTGTITVTVASTGGNNVSRFGLKSASGSYVAASVSAGATAITEGGDAGTYEVAGTSYVTLTFEVTEAGTYTLCAPSGTTNRGGRVQTITMVDTH